MPTGKTDSTRHLLGNPIVMSIEALSDKVNSTSAELNPLFTQKGKMLYFTRKFYIKNKFGPNDPEDIWQSKLGADGNWEEATGMPKFNNSDPNYITFIAPPTTTDPYLMILGNRYNPRKSHIKAAIKYSNSKDGINWSRPHDIKIATMETGLLGRTNCYLTKDRTTLVIAMNHTEGLGENDLYVCPADGKTSFGKPIHMGNIINSLGDDCSPYMTPDNKILYFSSNGRRDTYGGHDIYVSVRTAAGWTDWSVPLNLGKDINGAHSDLDFNILEDGETAYYAKGITHSNTDIYKARITFGNDMVLVKGRLLHKVTKQPAKGRMVVTQEEDGEWVATTESDPSNGEFDILIPPGKKYLFTVKGGLPQSTPTSLDLVNYKLLESRLPDIYTTPQQDPLVVPNSSKPSKATTQNEIAIANPKNDTKLSKATSSSVITKEAGGVSNPSIANQSGKSGVTKTTLDPPSVPKSEATPSSTHPTYSPSDKGESSTRPATSEFPDRVSGYEPFDPRKVQYIDFNLNEVAVEKIYLALLDQIALYCFQNPKAKLKLDGYTDNLGAEATNMFLSKRRAVAVRGYLVSQGIDEDRITVDFHGQRQMMENAHTEEADRKNRRVEIHIH